MDNSLQEIKEPSTSTIHVKPAGAWSRMWASVIDSMVVGLPVIILGFFISLIDPSVTYKSMQSNLLFGIPFTILLFAYYIYMTSKYGTTVGKDAYGLKVVKYGTHENLDYKASTIRELVKALLPYLIPFIGGIFALINGLIVIFSKEKRGIHDKAAKSQVIVVKPAWKMRRQIAFFGGYVLLIILIILLRPGFFSIPR